MRTIYRIYLNLDTLSIRDTLCFFEGNKLNIFFQLDIGIY